MSGELQQWTDKLNKCKIPVQENFWDPFMTFILTCKRRDEPLYFPCAHAAMQVAIKSVKANKNNSYMCLSVQKQEARLFLLLRDVVKHFKGEARKSDQGAKGLNAVLDVLGTVDVASVKNSNTQKNVVKQYLAIFVDLHVALAQTEEWAGQMIQNYGYTAFHSALTRLSEYSEEYASMIRQEMYQIRTSSLLDRYVCHIYTSLLVKHSETSYKCECFEDMEGFFVVLSISKFDKLVMAKKRTAPLYDTLQQLSEAITKHGDKVVVENEDRLIDTMTDLVDTTKFKREEALLKPLFVMFNRFVARKKFDNKMQIDIMVKMRDLIVSRGGAEYVKDLLGSEGVEWIAPMIQSMHDCMKKDTRFAEFEAPEAVVFKKGLKRNRTEKDDDDDEKPSKKPKHSSSILSGGKMSRDSSSESSSDEGSNSESSEDENEDKQTTPEKQEKKRIPYKPSGFTIKKRFILGKEVFYASDVDPPEDFKRRHSLYYDNEKSVKAPVILSHIKRNYQGHKTIHFFYTGKDLIDTCSLYCSHCRQAHTFKVACDNFFSKKKPCYRVICIKCLQRHEKEPLLSILKRKGWCCFHCQGIKSKKAQQTDKKVVPTKSKSEQHHSDEEEPASDEPEMEAEDTDSVTPMDEKQDDDDVAEEQEDDEEMEQEPDQPPEEPTALPTFAEQFSYTCERANANVERDRIKKMLAITHTMLVAIAKFDNQVSNVAPCKESHFVDTFGRPVFTEPLSFKK